MEIKVDKVKQEIMKDFKSRRYAEHDRIEGYTTGTLEPIGKGIQGGGAISKMTGKPGFGSISECCRTEPARSMQINELKGLIKSKA